MREPLQLKISQSRKMSMKLRKFKAFQEGFYDAFSFITKVLIASPDDEDLEARSTRRLETYDPSYLQGMEGDLTRIAHDMRKSIPEDARARGSL